MQIIIQKDRMLKLASVPKLTVNQKINDPIQVIVSSELFSNSPLDFIAYLCFIYPNKKETNKILELSNEKRNKDYIYNTNFDSSITVLDGNVNVRVEFINKKTDSIIRSSSQNIKILPQISTAIAQDSKNSNESQIISPMMANNFSLTTPILLSDIQNSSSSDIYYEITDENIPIDIIDRDIQMIGMKNVVVMGDTHSQIISFRKKRFIDNVDQAEKEIIIKFINANNYGDWANSINKQVSDEFIIFGWLIDYRVTVSKGKIKFGIDFIGKDEYGKDYLWRTKLASFDVEEGLDVDRQIEDFYPSILSEHGTRITKLENSITNINETAKEILSDNLQNIKISLGKL